MDRADHYRAAEYLLGKVRRQIEGNGGSLDEGQLTMFLAAAQVEATLAAVSADVERRVQLDARDAAAAVARAEELRGVGPAVVESPAYGTEPRDDDRPKPAAPIDLDIEQRQGPPERLVDRMCRCGGPVDPLDGVHRMGAPGCAYDVLGRLR